MLDKKHRLPKDIDFRNAKGFSSNAFLIKIEKSQSGLARFGVVVSKKIDKSAVGRNKIKRRIRSAIEKFLPGINDSWEVLVIARAGAREKSEEEIRAEISELLTKAKLLK